MRGRGKTILVPELSKTFSQGVIGSDSFFQVDAGLKKIGEVHGRLKVGVMPGWVSAKIASAAWGRVGADFGGAIASQLVEFEAGLSVGGGGSHQFQGGFRGFDRVGYGNDQITLAGIVDVFAGFGDEIEDDGRIPAVGKA